MYVTRKSRLQLRAQNWTFVILFLVAIGLIAWLSTQYQYRADWTYGQRNSLSTSSVRLLHSLKSPLGFTVYVRDNAELRQAIRRFLDRYTAQDKNASLTFINPDTHPDETRAAGITTANGELVITYQGRSEKVTQLDETSITNAIEQLARSTERYVVFLSGDGERAPLGQHNFDLGTFGQQLQNKGFKIETLNLAATPTIPINTAVLVIAGPQTALLPGAVRLIEAYVQRGGNLLWLGDPGPLNGLEPLAAQLGVSFGRGTIVDPDSQLFGINNPTIVLVAKYNPQIAITRGFNNVTAFVGATSVNANGGDWQVQDFLQTLPRSWLETGKLEGDVKYAPKRGDKPGPLNIGVTLTRIIKTPASVTSKAGGTADQPQEQRVVVTGDGDFLSNAYLNSGGNLTLGLNIMNWLSHDDSLLNINPRRAPDLTLTLSRTNESLIGLGFLLVLPLGLVVIGVLVWARRRRA